MKGSKMNIKNNNPFKNKEDRKNRFKEKTEYVKPILKNSTGIPMYSKVMAGVVLAPAVPVAVASAIASTGINIANDLINTAGFILSLPTTLLTTLFANCAEDANSKFSTFIFTGIALVTSLPSIAISIATAIPSGILKLADKILNLATKIVCLPFKEGASAILNHAYKKQNNNYDNIIDYDLMSQM